MNYKKIAKTTGKWAILLTGGCFIGITATKYIEPPEFIELLAEKCFQYTERFTEQFRFLPDNASIIPSLLEQKTAANQYLHNFPINIPGAGTITRYEVDGATRCLVHIRQLHRPPLNDSRFGKKRTQTIEVQQDIYNILSHLIQKSELTNVYEEGIYVSEDTPQDIVEESKDTVEGLLYLRQLIQETKDTKEKIDKNLRRIIFSKRKK